MATKWPNMLLTHPPPRIQNAQRGGPSQTLHTFTMVLLKNQDNITLDGVKKKERLVAVVSCLYSALLFLFGFLFVVVV